MEAVRSSLKNIWHNTGIGRRTQRRAWIAFLIPALVVYTLFMAYPAGELDAPEFLYRDRAAS